VHATVTLPGSKSITNRALVLAALASDSGNGSVIRRPLRSRDTQLMADALRSLGASVSGSADGADALTVQPLGTGPVRAQVNVGNAGTVLRFVPPVATLVTGEAAFDGDRRARERPVGALLGALRRLGAHIEDGGRAALPFSILGRGGIRGGAVTLDASGSSQLISSLLLAGARFRDGVRARHEGPPVPSVPHIAMTVAMLQAAGADAGSGPDGGCPGWWVRPGPVRPGAIDVEPDLSNAAPFLAAALVTGGSVTVTGWPRRTAQPGDALRDLLTEAGGSCELTASGLTVRGGRRIRGITASLREVSELTPVLTALAALASSPSRFTGIAHMRTHETDRLAALAREINALGGDVTELEDGLEIRPRTLRADGPAGGGTGVFGTYDDHRLVMAAAVLGLAVPGLRVENPATVGKTLPQFTSLWAGMLAGTAQPPPGTPERTP
jgi:3-phosphoshikimate 1-carboxyvinyltransferase